jgi:surfactin synthase thioesterase subunit
MDTRLLENKRFLNLFIRPVKVDYGLLLQYQAAEVPEKVTCDLTAFYASEDLTAEEVCQWQGYIFFLLALCEKVG